MWRLLYFLAVSVWILSEVDSVRTLNGCGRICGKAKPTLVKDRKGPGIDSFPVAGRVIAAKSRAQNGRKRMHQSFENNTETLKHKKSKRSKKDGQPNSFVEDADNRIVNGYEPNDRPWLALLDVAGGACGAALINIRYLLSAAHCFCRQSDPIICKEVIIEGKRTHQVSYDVTKHVTVYLGINNMQLSRKDDFPELKFGVENVVIRAGWIFTKTFTPDLSIARLNRNVRFSSQIAPICLPSSPTDLKDLPVNAGDEMKAFVAGWGAGFSQCDSNLFGPSPSVMCKFPFVYNGQKYDRCSRTAPPSADNHVCNQFYQWAKARDASFDPLDKTKTYSVFVWDTAINRARVTTCYSQQASHEGWCGTCYNGDLKPGEEGYCDKYQGGTELNTEREFGRPTPDSNWGWCSRWCDDSNGPAASEKLQETELDVLTPEECASFGVDLEANSSLELCTGRKTNFDYIYQFKRVQLADGQVTFRTEGKVQNMRGLPNSKYNFYLAGTDSCQGDSGGPLYRWYGVGEQRAFVIGTVSRGTGCANFNMPGIFSRASMHLQWIHAMTKEGDCGGDE